MSGLPGIFTNRIKISFVPESTKEEQEDFLSQSDYFICEIQQCKMREKSCIKNQKISRQKTRVGERELYRDFCIGCKQGIKIAKKYKVQLKDKEKNKCPRCGKIVEGKTYTSYTCMECKIELNNERVMALREGNTPSQIMENL